VRIDENLLEQAKREAHRRGETLTSLIEKGLRRELANGKVAPRPWVKVPVGRATGPAAPGLDLDSNASIQAFLDEGVPLDKLR
jgi:hypothetical protein